MNRTILVLLSLLFITSSTTFGQFEPAPVEKSNQKVLFQGKIYFVHTVQQNQTLSSISRAYGVTIQDIAKANPNIILEVISVGQTLRIPSISELNELSESYFGLSEDDFIYHTVQPQQTIFYISKKYNVSKEDIYYYNPGSEDLIQVDQTLKIPKPHVKKQEPQIEEVDDDPNKYIVKKGDTLYSLSKKYGISVAELIRTNPQLRWGLQEGMALHFDGSEHDINFSPNYDSLPGISLAKVELYSASKCDSIGGLNKNETIKIALLLPFHASELLVLDSITVDSVRRAHPYNRFRSRGLSFTEFYEGFLMAIDSLQKTGQHITLFTYDTKSDSTTTNNIIKELDIIRPNIIYGPIIPSNISRVSAYSKENKIPMILPLAKSTSKYTDNNPYTISMMPDSKAELNLSADYISQFHDKNIILIHNEDSAGLADIKEFRETLFAYFSSKAAYEDALYKEIRVNDTIQKNLDHALRENMDNIILVYSANEAYVSNIIGLLRINQSFGYSINVFGLPVWQSFDNLRVELLHMLNTVIYSPFYIDYTKEHTQQFVKKCRTVLKHEPYKTVNTGSGFNFTYLGYEAGLAFAEAYKYYGDNFLNCLCHLQFDMPQTLYRFEWKPEGGFTNVNINLINYDEEFNTKSIDFYSLQEINNMPADEDFDLSQFKN